MFNKLRSLGILQLLAQNKCMWFAGGINIPILKAQIFCLNCKSYMRGLTKDAGVHQCTSDSSDNHPDSVDAINDPLILTVLPPDPL
jgi:hypothetical protein